ncbi:MAG: class I SAM-dependent methyltransferase [Candidatus Omnitrophota bacterium]
MANFIPLKRYIFYCLDRMIDRYGIGSPFLDVGCGQGDVSAFLAQKGWEGKAIDVSPEAIAQARVRLLGNPVRIEQRSVLEEREQYRSVLMLDVLEHLEEDDKVLRAVQERLEPGGKLVLAVPSNPSEWRWDDDFYGHVRRYDAGALRQKIEKAGLRPILFWDFTFPVFWGLRRLYTCFKKPAYDPKEDPTTRTLQSTCRNAWSGGAWTDRLSRATWLWALVYWGQFRFFRNALSRGHEMLVLAEKPL